MDLEMALDFITKEINNLVRKVSKFSDASIENLDMKISIPDIGGKVNIFTFKIEKKPKENFPENFPFNNSGVHLMPCSMGDGLEDIHEKPLSVEESNKIEDAGKILNMPVFWGYEFLEFFNEFAKEASGKIAGNIFFIEPPNPLGKAGIEWRERDMVRINVEKRGISFFNVDNYEKIVIPYENLRKALS